MCGIFGYVTRKPRYPLSTVLGQGLIVDSLRGMCGTGIYGWDGVAKEGYIWKRALAGPDFVNTQQFDHYKSTAYKLNIAIGHNRASTIGSAKDRNCHPFNYDHISLVHNGTLRNHNSLMPVGEFSHEVDSAYAAKAISKYGAKEALEKIDGAFVFVWHDALANTFNIARNGMRDIWYITDKEGDNLYFASEYDMLAWILDRNQVETHGKYRSPAEFVHMTWDLTKPLNKPVGEQFEEYTPPKPVYSYNYNGRGRNRDADDLLELGIDLYEWLEVKDFSFDPYEKSNNGSGAINGTILVPLKEGNCEYKFRYHNVSKSELTQWNEAEHITVSAYSVWTHEGHPVVSCRNARFAKSKGDLLPTKEELFRVAEGRYVDRLTFERMVTNGCCYCGDPIVVNEATEIGWIKIGTYDEPVCPKCKSDPATMAELDFYKENPDKAALRMWGGWD